MPWAVSHGCRYSGLLYALTANGRTFRIPPGKYGEIGFMNRNFQYRRNALPWPGAVILDA